MVMFHLPPGEFWMMKLGCLQQWKLCLLFHNYQGLLPMHTSRLLLILTAAVEGLLTSSVSAVSLRHHILDGTSNTNHLRLLLTDQEIGEGVVNSCKLKRAKMRWNRQLKLQTGFTKLQLQPLKLLNTSDKLGKGRSYILFLFLRCQENGFSVANLSPLYDQLTGLEHDSLVFLGPGRLKSQVAALNTLMSSFQVAGSRTLKLEELKVLVSKCGQLSCFSVGHHAFSELPMQDLYLYRVGDSFAPPSGYCQGQDNDWLNIRYMGRLAANYGIQSQPKYNILAIPPEGLFMHESNEVLQMAFYLPVASLVDLTQRVQFIPVDFFAPCREQHGWLLVDLIQSLQLFLLQGLHKVTVVEPLLADVPHDMRCLNHQWMTTPELMGELAQHTWERMRSFPFREFFDIGVVPKKNRGRINVGDKLLSTFWCILMIWDWVQEMYGEGTLQLCSSFLEVTENVWLLFNYQSSSETSKDDHFSMTPGHFRSELTKLSVEDTLQWQEFQETEAVIDTLHLWPKTIGSFLSGCLLSHVLSSEIATPKSII